MTKFRTLIYDVDGQEIKENSKCSFDGIVSGTKGYICLQFHFSDEWKDMVKVLQASNEYNFEAEHCKSIKNDCCMLPDEVTDQNVIYLRVIGKRDNRRMITKTIYLRQEV